MVKDISHPFDKLKKAIIKWGYKCNNDCIFCHSASYRNERCLSTDELKNKIEDAKRLGVKLILFSGGEPLLIPQLEEILDYTFASGMYSGLITNGRLLANNMNLKKLYDRGLRYVYMSLVSLSPNKYKEITGFDGLNEAITAISNIVTYKSILFTINIPIIKQNIDEIVDVACRISLLSINKIKLSVIEPKGYAFKNYNEVVPPLSKSASVINEAIREVNKIKSKTSTYHDGLPPCLSPDYERYNRDMYSENILYMSESFEGKLFKVDYKNMDYAKGICDLCIKKKKCKGIYKGYIEAGDTPLIPFGRHKPKAIEKKGKDILNTNKNYEVNIGKLCNNSCIFCANGIVSKEENKLVDFQKIKFEIQKAYNSGFRSLGFLGGEITIHPDVLNIIKFAKEVGFERISLCTNGRRLSDYNFTKSLVDAGATRFMISIHSHREEIENFLNNRNNAFREKIEGLKNLVKMNNKIKDGISLNTCIHNLNYKELEEFITFFKNLKIFDFRFNFIRPENKAQFDKNIIPNLTSLKPYIENLIIFSEKQSDISVAIGDIPYCLLPDILLKDGRLLKKYIGELRDFDTFVTTFMSKTDPNFIDRFNWRERKVNFLKVKSPLCNKCTMDFICEGLFKNYISLYGIKELTPIKNLPQF
ncbi:MAG: radical SAM protein [Deltaproteobacteria bacterium]|nr:radical SAM protein [Deltaproteobacteria bacterium]